MITNKNNSVLYIGVTSDLRGRMEKHINKTYPSSFSRRYNLNKLVWYEYHKSIGDAIKREKQLKAGSRKKKIDLINNFNPEWHNLLGTLRNN